ncbi:Tmem144 [Symbiodinium necroappetens]|uniref:Tmem144 protein n=1 Tax=Symbiodinium necroappetens TaxID=1628268 RepID=A0A813C7X3_9DINO|nr:Tmem144 [Symbiodinium necroappetens]
MFFQLALCLGIWFTGLVVLLLRSHPTFYPVAMTGGVLWCSGNCLTVYIIKQIGLGPGLVMWGTAALIIGWVTGFFGLFGLPSEQSCLEKPWLNVVGVVLAMCALALSTLVRKSTPQKPLPIDAGRVPPTINEDVEESPARAAAGRAKAQPLCVNTYVCTYVSMHDKIRTCYKTTFQRTEAEPKIFQT